MLLATMISGGSNYVEPGSIEYDIGGDYEFVVPKNVKEVTLCMIGGGCAGHRYSLGRGGFAGIIYNGPYATTPGETISLTVAKVSENDSETGYPSNFGDIVCLGGQDRHYYGDGEETINCMGTFNDGDKYGDRWGGQAGFADGGNVDHPGSRGSGGGGATNYNYTHNGGAGVIHISWG